MGIRSVGGGQFGLACVVVGRWEQSVRGATPGTSAPLVDFSASRMGRLAGDRGNPHDRYPVDWTHLDSLRRLRFEFLPELFCHQPNGVDSAVVDLAPRR